ncbi:MAG: UDP-N-acetylmuramate--L-alanine ligase [Alphaproteobacteria bacterium]|nr:UDP-N-acetylmuramate--L-alanine ligase [Alphaproteobacteria bacterium]
MSKLNLANFDKSKAVHFIGIAGIGMSSIAETMKSLDYEVQGSNNIENENMASLRAKGIKAFIGHRASNLDGAGAVVYSNAIANTNVELLSAKSMGLPLIERAEMLDALMRLKKGISIAGTHGKTTTTSFVGTMLDIAGLKPTIINGGVMNYYGSHNRIGEGDWLVAETCEAFGNLDKFTPTIAVITNIDAEHLDFYSTFENVKNTFENFIKRTPKGGLVVLCADHPTTRELADKYKGEKTILTYGLTGGDIRAENIRRENFSQTFDVIIKGEKIADVMIPIAGAHNIQNALVAFAIAHFLGVSHEKMKEAAAKFLGVKHRFTLVGETKNGIEIYDDYAHHPKEIEATLTMARSVVKPGTKIFALFEPHRYSRLTDLFHEFSECFKLADGVIVFPVYSAGEAAHGMKNEKDILDAVQKSTQTFPAGNIYDAAQILKRHTRAGDMVISFSAGAIKEQVALLPELLNANKD